jgi:glycosyltransferase involved in cell wall biosynthesis
MPFSVLILTLNEAATLPRLLDRLEGISDDIIVLDSQSSDETREIAGARGCRVFVRPFDSELSQRAFGNTLPFRHPWVYNPDADELPDARLIAEMLRAAKPENRVAAYEVRFRNYLNDRWIRYSTDYPVWVVRLFRPECLSFSREVNLRYTVKGPVGRLEGHFEHFPFAKGLDWWITKHSHYSDKEAQEALKVIGTSHLRQALANVMAARSSKERRIALKEVSFFLPFRGTLRFFYSYLFRLGFMDGPAGLKYSALIALYEFMIAAKIRARRERPSLSLPPKRQSR